VTKQESEDITKIMLRRCVTKPTSSQDQPWTVRLILKLSLNGLRSEIIVRFLWPYMWSVTTTSQLYILWWWATEGHRYR
jgi:hypothetical protein